MIQRTWNRARNILFTPEQEWLRIDTEESTFVAIFRNYILLLAVIPSAAGFLGSLFRGNNFFLSLIWTFFFYILSVVGVYVTVKIVDFLATNLNIEHEHIKIHKLIAYSFTPFFLAGIVLIIPPLFWLSLLGLYGIFVLYIGVNVLLKPNDEERYTFIILTTITIIIIIVVVFTLTSALTGINSNYILL